MIVKDSFFWLVSITSYYRFFKGAIFALVHRFIQFKIFAHAKKKYTPQEIAGVTELGLVALSHVLFSILLIVFLGLDIQTLGLFQIQPHHLIYGILLGISEMSVSFLLCLGAIKIIQKFSPGKTPQNNTQWKTIARGGWVRHHIQSFELLPFALALFVLFLQVGSEELIFRGIITHSLLQNGHGPLLSISLSILFFVCMQAFHTPGFRTAIFPMTGALVMGITHSFLYHSVPVLPPLIIAHVMFFLMTIL